MNRQLCTLPGDMYIHICECISSDCKCLDKFADGFDPAPACVLSESQDLLLEDEDPPLLP